MCPYAVSVTGTATTFDTASTAVIKLDKISQGSYPTKCITESVIQKTTEAVYPTIIAPPQELSSYTSYF